MIKVEIGGQRNLPGWINLVKHGRSDIFLMLWHMILIC